MDKADRAVAPFERYRPRAVSQLGLWHVGQTRFKVYGILADGRTLTEALLREAEDYVTGDVPAAIAGEGCGNGLGFVIIHPGELGLTVAAHWWVQGSVLCQRIRRRLYGSATPLDQSSRAVIGCVWELGLIDAEQRIWRDTMMSDRPDPSAYLGTRVGTDKA